jgi:hypothetical protein
MLDHHEPPTGLVAAATAALRDLDPDNRVNISYERSDSSSDAWIVMLDFADGSRTGFEVVASQSAENLSVALADGLQQSVIDHYQVAIPQCPRHEHPLLPRALNGVAVWSCAQSDKSWPIGSLASR